MLDILSILAIGLVGGIVPLFFRWGDRQHHIALAFSTGVFLGAVFLHLLPSVAAMGEGADSHAHAAPSALVEEVHAQEPVPHDHDGDGIPDHGPGAHGEGGHDDHAGHDHGAEGDDEHDHDSHAGHVHGAIGPWLWVLVGLLGVFLVEALLIPGSTHGHGHDHDHDDHKRHAAVGWAALVGLTVHALTAGVALAAVQDQEAIAGVMLLAILAHKGFESFSLSAVFSMTGATKSRIAIMVVLFSLVTPLGVVLGGQLTGLLGDDGIGRLTALAAGTFLYVCLCELLPEVFHRREDGPLKIGLLGVGIACMWYAHSYGGI